jgi:hypothetical protein
MIRVSGSFLYELGFRLHPLQSLNVDWTNGQVYAFSFLAESWVDTLLNNSVYKLQTCYASGSELLGSLKEFNTHFLKAETKADAKVDWWHQFRLTTQSKTFETVLLAEMATSHLYLVEPKGGYDLRQLTESGWVIFPPVLIEKVPEAIQDAKEAARCLAFALPTAAAFHLHRLHELVLRRYYDTVTSGAPRPANRNIGAYIDAMKNAHFKDPKVYSALANLKDFHRNPVLHPDDRLEDVQEAIALLGSINTVITYMLKAIQPAPLKLTPPPANEIQEIEDKTPKALNGPAGDAADAV